MGPTSADPLTAPTPERPREQDECGNPTSSCMRRVSVALALGFTIVSHFVDVLGLLWPDANCLQPLSLFHYVKPHDVLSGTASPVDFVVLAGAAIAGVAFALVRFPARTSRLRPDRGRGRHAAPGTAGGTTQERTGTHTMAGWR
jgi:hypothetical protein